MRSEETENEDRGGYQAMPGGSTASGERPSNTYWGLWWCQFDALVRKNLEIFYRRPKLVLMLLLAPAAMTLLLLLLVRVSDGTPADLQATTLVPRECHNFNFWGESIDVPCMSIAFSPDTPAFQTVMRLVAEEAGYKYGSEVKAFSSKEEVAKLMFNEGRLGYMDAGVLFDSDSPDGTVAYTLWVNTTAPYANMGDDFHYGALQASVNRAIMHHFSSVDAPDVEITIRPFSDASKGTIVADKGLVGGGSQVIQLGCAVLILLGHLLTMLVVVYLVTTEKKERLLGQMRMMGLIHSTYWLSWFCVFAMTSTISSLIFALVGQATKIQVFANTDLGVLFVFSLCFSLSTIAFALFLASFLRQPRWVTSASFAVVMGWIIMTFIFQIDSNSVRNQYAPGTSVFSQILEFLSPVFHYTKVYADIISITQLNSTSVYTWSTMQQQQGPFPDKDGELWYSPSTSYSLGCLVGLVVLYMVFAWYFGQVFGGDFGESLIFFLLPEYWVKSVVDEAVFEGDTLEEVRQASLLNQDVRIHKMSKSYEQTTALKELSLTMRNNEIFCLLGHNGAGKSTAIHCLTGLHNATHGDAFVFGMSVKHQMKDIQSMMGVCPQDDVLFLDLSGRSHLRFWSRFKGNPHHRVGEEVTRALEDVTLTTAGDSPAGTYSGGMKRRLSVAIASVGDPRMIILDEPTTGMDPLSRRRVWTMIERLKANRVICLTTHSMEEADVLGNEIAILASGRLRAIGSSLFLKNRFGKGYQVSLMTEGDSEAAILVPKIKDMLPGADVLSNSAGYVTVGIPKGVSPFIPRFFQYLEKDGHEFVREWGISNTTLEEVFMRLAVQNKEINAVGALGDVDVNQQIIVEPLEDPQAFTDQEGGTVRFQEVALLTGAGTNILPGVRVYTIADALGSTSSLALPAPYEVSGVSDVDVSEEKEVLQDLSGQERDANGPAPAALSMNMDEADEFAIGYGDVTMGKQVRALLLKSVAFQRHQRRSTCCSLCFMVILILLSLLLGLLIPDGERNQQKTCSKDVKYNCLCEGTGVDWSNEYTAPNSYTLCTPEGFVEYVSSKSESAQDLSPPTCIRERGSLEPCTSVPLPGSQDGTPWVYALDAACGYSGSYQQGDTTRVWLHSTSSVEVPLSQYNITGLGVGVMKVDTYPGRRSLTFTVVQNDMDEAARVAQDSMLSGVVDVTGKCDQSCGSSSYAFFTDNATEASDVVSSRFPDFGISATKSNPRNLALHATVSVWSQAQQQGYHYDSILYPLASAQYKDDSSSYQSCRAVALSDMFHDSLYLYSDNDFGQSTRSLLTVVDGLQTILLNSAGDSQLQRIQTRLSPFPKPSFRMAAGDGDGLDPVFILAMVFLPTVTMIAFPASVQLTLAEKKSNVLVMMKMQGLRPTVYWLASWAWSMVMYCFFTGVFVALNFAVGVEVYAHSDVAGLLVALLVWGHATIAMSVLISSLLSQGTMATIICIFIVLVTSVLSVVMSISFPVNKEWPWILDVVPQLAFVHSLICAFNKGVKTADMYGAIGLLAIEGSVLLFAGVALQVRDLSSSTDTSCVDSVRALCVSKRSVKEDMMMDDVNSADDMDVDVRAEEARVAEGVLNSAINIRGLGKTFPPQRGRAPKRAVKTLTLSIDYSECFGLLGPNGAGKTTTLNMLSGYLKPSCGTTTIAGRDIVTEMDKVHKVLGMCPQFDWVWEELTVEDHLLLYIRLKGITPVAERAAVQRISEAVELDGDAFHTPARSLSGGMRRRLSLGIALCGDPRVLFLDEPTTGLDPETRQGVWQIINKAKRGRCIVLTTHSMEEADALCQRIGIMADGSLQCLGSQLHLKNRFGSGYQLKISTDSFDDRPLDEVDDFVRSLTQHGDQVVVTSSVNRARSYTLPRAGTSISTVFKRMEEQRERMGIREWGISMTTLDEVFMRIAEAAEGKAS